MGSCQHGLIALDVSVCVKHINLKQGDKSAVNYVCKRASLPRHLDTPFLRR